MADTLDLTRALIEQRLGSGSIPQARGDVATAHALLARGGLMDFVDEGYGVVPSSGIPYERGAGAPGVRLKRTPAAVLVPLIDHADGLTVLLTKRTGALARHAGQVAFPGGRLEDADADEVAAALRETKEEIGLPPQRVEIIGRLDPYLTITGFEVIPVVGAINPPVDLAPDPSEVEEIFEVPLAFLMNPANHQRVRRRVNGLDRAYFAMPYGNRYIWGATAGMLMNLYERLVD